MKKKELTREQYHKGLIGKVPKKWHKEMLEAFDKDMLEEQNENFLGQAFRENKELQDKLMEMPDLESQEDYNNMKEARDYYMEKYNDLKKEEDELIHKRMNDINTFQAHENEVYLRGTDEYGKDFQICFDAYNFLEWIDTEHLEYIKEQLVKHIKLK